MPRVLRRTRRRHGRRLATSINLQATLRSAALLAGFTAATGSGYENRDILSWTFEGAFSDGDRVFGGGFDAG